MKIKLQNLHGVIALSADEQSKINGGAEDKSSYPNCESIWCDLGFVVRKVVDGLTVFATEGGRNAGLVVR